MSVPAPSSASPPPARPGGEFALIDWIRHQAGPHPRLEIGIGDDAASVSWPDADSALVAVDMLVEDVHFTCPEASPEQIGRKALAVNLSDIAAMAGRPIAAVISVALPRTWNGEPAQRLHSGLTGLARQTGVALAGGDTTSTDGPLVISVTVIGESLPGGPVLRSGAQPGDRVLVTGRLGNSLDGHHLDFTPRLAEAAALLESGGLHAMIDISDGLATDLHHVLHASGVGARLNAADIPLNEFTGRDRDGRTRLAHAIADGEDFELLSTVSPAVAARLVADPPFETPLTDIGEITEGCDVDMLMPDGRIVPLPPLGYEHEVG